MTRGKTYGQLSSVGDPAAANTLRLLFDKLDAQAAKMAALQSTVDGHATSITGLQSSVSTATNQALQAQALAVRAAAAPPAPSGSSDTTGSGGTGGANSYGSLANHQATVEFFRNQYLAAGHAFDNLSAIFNGITLPVAQALAGLDPGKAGGNPGLAMVTGSVTISYQGSSVSVSRIMYPDGTLVKILGDTNVDNGVVSGAWFAEWLDNGSLDPTAFKAV